MTPTIRLLRPLGQGGMGRVWVAEHLTLETNVVVKFMANDIAATADGAARFAREASVAAAVKSPHVVQVFDHGVTADGDAFIVMELLEGRDLAAQLATHGPMTPADVAGLVAQVAKALGKAHKVGVVHRDIKPDNIFLCDGEGGELFVKLLDFGIAKRDEHRVKGTATTTGAVVGTPYYMSPEQIVGEKEIDARTDIWSLGVVAFEAMTGRRPFEGVTVGAITLAIHTSSPRPSEHLPGAPAAVDTWFARVCARDPKERFQTAREAAQALLQAVGGLPAAAALVRAPMPSMVGDGSDPSIAALASSSAALPSDGRAPTHLSSAFPVPRPSRARPALVVAAVAVVLALVGGMLVLPALLRPAAANPTPSGGAVAPDPPVAASAPPSASGAASEDNAALTASAASPSGSPSAAPAAAGSDAPGADVVPSPGTQATATAPRPTAAPKPSTGAKPTPGGRRTKPGRTRDDDDIK